MLFKEQKINIEIFSLGKTNNATPLNVTFFKDPIPLNLIIDGLTEIFLVNIIKDPTENK